MPEDYLEEQGQIDFRKYGEILRRRRWYFLVPFFIGWLAVWGISWFMPSVYRSGTLILVEQPTVPAEMVPTTASADLQSRLDSIEKQIRSRTRLLAVIDKLNLYAKDRAHHMSDDTLVDDMNKDLTIEQVRSPGKEDLTSFNIYFSADNPYVAQQVTNELSNILISENIEAGIQNSGNINKFLDSQLEEARKSLADQDEKVREFKDRYRGELPTETAANLQIMGGEQSQLQAEEDALGRAKQQNVYLQSLISQYRTTQENRKPGQPAAVGLPALDETLDRLHAQLADLTSRYTDQYPDVRKVREQIDKTEKMRTQLLAEMKAKAAQAQADPNSNSAVEYATPQESGPMMEVESQLKANQIEIANRQRAIVDLQAKINGYQDRLSRAPAREQELADLTRDYNQSQANYDSLLAKRNQSELVNNLNKSQEGQHFRMIDPPSLPTKPFSPDRFKMSLAGLGVGLVLGLLSVVGGEFVDDRMYDEEEFKKLLAVDVMAEIPPLPTEAEEGQRRTRFVMEWAAVAVLSLITVLGVTISYLRS